MSDAKPAPYQADGIVRSIAQIAWEADRAIGRGTGNLVPAWADLTDERRASEGRLVQAEMQMPNSQFVNGALRTAVFRAIVRTMASFD